MSYPRLLTIQDISCVGQCSGTVALPLVSACGVECAILPSAVLSTHTGPMFRRWTFHDLTDDIPGIAVTWKGEGIAFDAFYTGYVCAAQIDPILSVMDRLGHPGALRIVDPVMGDNGKQYAGFAPDFPEQMKRLVKGADYILPNLTEAALLLGRRPVLEGYDEAYVAETVQGLMALGAKNVILTGVSFEKNRLGIAVSDGKSIRYDFNDYVPGISHGTGDIFASVFSGALLSGRAPFAAAALAADFVCEAIRLTPKDHIWGAAFERALPMLVNEISHPRL